MRGKKVAVALVAVAAGVAVPAVASAQDTTEPSVTITLSAEQVRSICEVRIPKIERRVARAQERISGGAEVRGSVAWLEKRAEVERAAGRETVANLLAERAERRAERGPQLEGIGERVEGFKAQYCGGK